MKSLLFLLFVLSLSAVAETPGGYLELVEWSTPAPDSKNARLPFEQTESCDGQSLKACLAFTLPKELVGDQVLEVVLKSPKPIPGTSFYELTGKGHTAVCVRTGNSTSCLLQFSDLQVNLEEVEAYLKTQITDENALRIAKNRASAFSRSPVLRFWYGLL